MHWLLDHIYIAFWVAAAATLVIGLVKMLSRTIIGKGEFTRLLLIVITIASVAAFFTPQFDEAIRFCAKLLLAAEAIYWLWEWKKARR